MIMDYATKWPETFPVSNMLTEAVVEHLIEVTTRLGVPHELLSDNGSNFISKVMQQFCMLMGMKQIKTSPYHSQTNGMVERFNATLKRLSRKIVANPRSEWDDSLTYVLWAYRGTTHKTTGFYPYQLLFGKEMKMPLDQLIRYWKGKEEEDSSSVSGYIHTLKANMEVVREMAYEREKKKEVKQKKYYDQKAKEHALEVGSFVLVLGPP